MKSTPFPYSIPAASVEALHRMQSLAELVAYNYGQTNAMPLARQIDGMAVAVGQIAATLAKVTDEIDAASHLPVWNAGGQADDAR